MATVYYPQFDVIRIEVDGERITLAAESVNVYNVTASASLGTLVSDANGVIVEGSFTATLFDVIEISHATYPLTCRFVLQATQLDAYTAAENNVACYIAENLYTDTTESKTARLYVIDLDNPDVKPEYLADLRPEIETQIPYQSSVTKNFRLSLVSQDINGQFKTADVSQSAQTFDITIPAISSGSLFDHTADVTTGSTATETLLTDQVDAGKLATDGDKITVDIAGVYAANANRKSITLVFAGTTIFSSGNVTENDKRWRATVLIIRVSNTVVRVCVQFATSIVWTPVYTEITGLTLGATNYNIVLNARTVDNAGDLTAKMGYGMFVPAA